MTNEILFNKALDAFLEWRSVISDFSLLDDPDLESSTTDGEFVYLRNYDRGWGKYDIGNDVYIPELEDVSE